MNDQARDAAAPGPDATQPGAGRGNVTGRGGVAQVALVGLSWLFLCGMHWNNDGLWGAIDPPRHAANGLFWKAYLQSPSLNPKDFALSYLARYPIINPVSYPPVFYVLEAAAYSVFGASPYVAKALVLIFTLVAALYTTAWIRRWVAREAGVLGALVPLLPTVVVLSHSVMLNMPSFALATAALYHARRWLDEPESRQIYPAAILSLLAILCYLPSAVLVFILVAWIIALGRLRVLMRPRTLLLATTCGVVLLPWALLVIRWSPGYVEMTTPTSRTITSSSSWTYYLDPISSVFGHGLPVLAGVGAVAGVLGRHRRRETSLLLIWIGVTFLALTYLKAKDSRYILPLATPLTCLAAIAIVSLAHVVERWLPRRVGTPLVLAIMISVVIAQAWQAWRVPIPEVHGVSEIVAFLERNAPDDAVLYDGASEGIFIFYVQAGDPDFRRRVVRGSKLIYAYGLHTWMKPREFVTSRQDVIEVLQRRSGCRWLAIEEWPARDDVLAARLLREVVQGPEFKRVRSFPISGTSSRWVDLYRVLVPVEEPETLDLPIGVLGPDVHLELRPISRARKDSGVRQTP